VVQQNSFKPATDTQVLTVQKLRKVLPLITCSMCT